MHHSPIGIAQRKMDTVARAMDILKDRPMPQPKRDTRQNFGQNSRRPNKSPA
jgi:hypothetical protein